MTNSWLYILGLMIAGSALTAITGSLLVAILCDIGVFIGGYFILRRDPYVPFRPSMFFLGCITVINILFALGFISHTVSNEAMISLILWSWFGARSKLFRLFILGSVIYNGVGIYQLYRNFGYIDVPTTLVSLGALVLISYIDRD